MKRAMSRCLLPAVGAMLLTACATMVQGTTQKVSVRSTPSGAVVSVDGSAVGITPAFVELTRGDEHRLRVEAEGYRPYETTITHSMNGWMLGNVVLGGVIGIAIDSSSGAIYSLDQDEIVVELKKAGEPQAISSSGIYIIVTSSHPADVRKIADLQKV